MTKCCLLSSNIPYFLAGTLPPLGILDKFKKGLSADGGQPLDLTGGDDGDRTHDLHVANVALSQLSYIPFEP